MYRLLLVGINTHYPLRHPPPWGAAEIEKSACFQTDFGNDTGRPDPEALCRQSLREMHCSLMTTLL